MKAYKTKEEMKQLYKKIGFQTIEFFEHPNKKWVCMKGIK